MLTFELFEHGSKSKLKSEILLYYKVKKTLHVLNLPNGWNSVYHNLCNGMESSTIVDARSIVSQAYPNKLP